jgi:hypothetical protein
MRILADEGFNEKFVNQLRTSGFSVDWILEQYSGISDDKVIEIAIQQANFIDRRQRFW